MATNDHHSYRRKLTDLWTENKKELIDEEAVRDELMELQYLLIVLNEHKDELPEEVLEYMRLFDKNAKDFKASWENIKEMYND